MWWCRLPNALLLAAALAGCSTPVARVPDIDRERTRAEAQVQQASVRQHGPALRHHLREADDPLSRDLAEAARITAIGWRILTANVELCGERTDWQIGALFETIHDVTPMRDYWYNAIRLDNNPVLMALAPGGPAERVGFQLGDEIIAVDGRKLDRGKGAVDQLQEWLNRPGRREVELVRATRSLTLAVEPVRACRSRMRHDRWANVNAYADGKSLAVTSGMLGFITDDNHLAAVIGHELAHNSMGHLEKQDENGKAAGRFGKLLSTLAGAPELEDHWTRVGERAYSRSFEAEADYVGLYFAANAGFKVDDAPLFWRRMAVANPLTIKLATTHPTTPERFVALEETAREIAGKRERGMPLVPERR